MFRARLMELRRSGLEASLADKTNALTSAATRTGRYLIGFLPSLPEDEGL